MTVGHVTIGHQALQALGLDGIALYLGQGLQELVLLDHPDGCADFLQFAKHVAPEEYNRKAIPEAVGFVMGTYKEEPQEEKEAQ